MSNLDAIDVWIRPCIPTILLQELIDVILKFLSP